MRVMSLSRRSFALARLPQALGCKQKKQLLV
jgi:hypothetical protein